MLSKEMIREVVTLRNNEDCNIINIVDEVNIDVLKASFKEINENKSLSKEFYITVKDLDVDTLGGGFKYTQAIKEMVGKALKVSSLLIKNRTEEDAQRGGRAGEILGVRVEYVTGDNEITRLIGAIDEDFIEQVYCIEFKRPEFTKRIDVINKRIVENSKSSEEELRVAKDKWQRAQNKIRDYRDAITSELRQARQHSLTIAALESQKEKDFTSDLNALAGHRFFEDLRVEGSELIFTTTYIDIIDPNNTDVVFEGNKYEIKVNLRNNDVRFFGLDKSRCHKSCWTNEDPHPHVNGGDGRACLGNISATLVELCESREIYALFISLTNFLQTFNIEDYAGKKIKNWNTKDGIKHPYNETFKCKDCGETLEDEDDIRHCDGCGAVLCNDCGSWHNERDGIMCDDCYDNLTYVCQDENCDNRVENEDDLNICSVCEIRLCDDCTYEIDGVDYCKHHYEEELERRRQEREEETQEVIQEEILSNTFTCEKCQREVELGAKHEWINEDFSVISICPICLEELAQA